MKTFSVFILSFVASLHSTILFSLILVSFQFKKLFVLELAAQNLQFCRIGIVIGTITAIAAADCGRKCGRGRFLCVLCCYAMLSCHSVDDDDNNLCYILKLFIYITKYFKFYLYTPSSTCVDLLLQFLACLCSEICNDISSKTLLRFIPRHFPLCSFFLIHSPHHFEPKLPRLSPGLHSVI